MTLQICVSENILIAYNDMFDLTYYRLIISLK